MLKVADISKSYGPIQVLRNVSLEISRGEIVAVTGPSGAGKTTLLQIMGTLERPDSGSVTFEGKSLTSLGDRDLSAFRNSSLGFVFQSHQLLPEFTLLENVMMPAMIGNRPLKEARRRAAALLEEVGLSHRAGHKPAQMSGGECQRGAVARALMNEPGIVLADEPTGNLDSANSLEVSKLFFELRSRHGSTFVIVTHDVELAARCDRSLHIVDGEILHT